MIWRPDALAMVDLVDRLGPGAHVDLLLNSPGGDIDAAEKIGHILDARVGEHGHIRVIVPEYAKSAATLIALGADEILMSDPSELGIIDPQVTLTDGHGLEWTSSAQTYLDAFHTHAAALKADHDDAAARLMLSKLDPAVAKTLDRMMQRSRAIAIDRLLKRMIDTRSEAETIAAILLDTTKWLSHGQMISYEHAVGIGLNVTYEPPGSWLWSKVWTLYCLQSLCLEPGHTLFESDYVSMVVP